MNSNCVCVACRGEGMSLKKNLKKMKISNNGTVIMALALIISTTVLLLVFNQQNYVDGMGSVLLMMVLLFCITR